MNKVFVVCRRVTDFDDECDSFEDVICVCKTKNVATAAITDFMERRRNSFPTGVNGKWIGHEYVIMSKRQHWCLWVVETSFVE